MTLRQRTVASMSVPSLLTQRRKEELNSGVSELNLGLLMLGIVVAAYRKFENFHCLNIFISDARYEN